jgi:hypothetical protein
MKVSGIRHRHLHDDTNIRGFIRSHFYFFKVLLCLRVSISMKVSSIQQKHLHATNTFGYIQSHFYFVKLLLCLHVYEGVRIWHRHLHDTDTCGFIQSQFYFLKLLLCLRVSVGIGVTIVSVSILHSIATNYQI